MQLLHSHYDFKHVLRNPIRHVKRLLIAALKKKQEDRAWQMWLMQYQHMTEKNFVPFSEFYSKQTASPQSVTSKTKEEILADTDMILRSLRKERPEGR